MTRLAIHGAAGRMGRRLVALAGEAADLEVVAAADHAGCAVLGQDAGVAAGVGPIGVALADALSGSPEVVIDFSTPAGTRAVTGWAVAHQTPLVIGTTGLTEADDRAITDAAGTIPVLWASNFSLVVNVLWKLAAEAAQLLGDGYDIEILEAHHRFKKDAPSGTAHTLARRICAATGRDADADVIYTRHGDDVPRDPKQVTVQTLRLGDHPGEHTAYFAALGERLEIRHVSTSRDSYVVGALQAARWLAGKPAGRYDMNDVLGL